MQKLLQEKTLLIGQAVACIARAYVRRALSALWPFKNWSKRRKNRQIRSGGHSRFNLRAGRIQKTLFAR